MSEETLRSNEPDSPGFMFHYSSISLFLGPNNRVKNTPARKPPTWASYEIRGSPPETM